MFVPDVNASARSALVEEAAATPVCTRTSANEVPNPVSIRVRNPDGSAEPPTRLRWTEVSDGAEASVDAGAVACDGLWDWDCDLAGGAAVGPDFTGHPPDTIGHAGNEKDWPVDQSFFGDLNPTADADQNIAALSRCPAYALQGHSYHDLPQFPTILSTYGMTAGRVGLPAPE